MINNLTFEPLTLNISDIFRNGNVVYKVPEYQRRYSWGNNQLDALWGDLIESFENDVKGCYFLGSIVVVNDKGNYYELIDGQQRITTLMIMISVLYKTFPDLNCYDPDNPEDESSVINSETFENCLFYRKGKRRLNLQTDVKYDTDFKEIIINTDDFSSFKTVTKSEMKKEDPIYNFKNTAKFFYDKFNDINFKKDRKLENFVYYIFNNVFLIRITCKSVPFAIKLFQVMNDRGMPLSSADIIKSYIMGRIDKETEESYKEVLKNKFTSNWSFIENIVKKHNLKMDDFIVYYEYFKLKANPKRQVIDELKSIIEDVNNDITNIVDEIKIFADCLNEMLSLKDSTIYSLKYLPWPTYINTCLASIKKVKYGISIKNIDGFDVEDDSEQKELIELMRRYFYLAFISGKTLNQIKQTSFNLLRNIIEKTSVQEINKILEDSIYKYKMIRGTYEALEDEVCGESFLKPLLLSIEYANREKTNTTFVEIDKELHVDHILPKAFETNKNNDWAYINKEEGDKYMNTLGNMALLYYKKNEEALNKGFKIKCNIYEGKNEDGSPNNSGETSFETTKEIIKISSIEHRFWNIEDIKNRYNTQIERIERLLRIKKDINETE